MKNTLDNKTLYLIRGCPGSGKSTYAKALAKARDMHHYEADMYFVDADGNYNFDVTQLGNAHRWCEGSVRVTLQTEDFVVVSNTFTTWKEICPYYKIAMDSAALLSIVNMTHHYGNVHDVPQQTLDKMKARYASKELILSYDWYDLMEWSDV